MRGLSLVSAVLLAASGCLAQDYTVRNQCPTPIEWFIGTQSQGTLGIDERAFRPGLGPTPPPIWTNANLQGGNPTTAEFHLVPEYGYYYVVRDPDNRNFNTGIRIEPGVAPHNLFCMSAQCHEGNCTTAYRHRPVWDGVPPRPIDLPAPAPPLHQCLDPEASFEIIFCFDRQFPQTRGAPIVFGGNHQKCVDVSRGSFVNGTPVQLFVCNNQGSQRWNLQFAGTKIQVVGTNFCLDAGSTPGNGVPVKIWECFDNLPAQQWYLTDDNRIALAKTGLCLDLPEGNMDDRTVLQTWQCTDNNPNQVWLLPDQIN
ncbi:G-X-X-X-Q-X-W domain-containing protein [Coprinopsis marcescibilis]|uniref:G-X-X-X-Q-X-W domain-containing protein n=1 Tax=Coprinopsis marcescibilis TaxID=230819 RepID=A0A5C3L8X9_COPMA|nr:G-X-X-X-Q-X-W domain-containing protein [Coprinopsis marcescibilis]